MKTELVTTLKRQAIALLDEVEGCREPIQWLLFDGAVQYHLGASQPGASESIKQSGTEST